MAKNDKQITALYRGPSLHERILTKKELMEALDLPENKFPEDFVRLRWAPDSGRRSVDVTEMPEQVIQLLREDESMEVREDGEITDPAVPDAGHVYPDGSSAGVDGNPVLAEAIGYERSEPESSAGSDAGAGASTTGSVGAGVGGSTSGTGTTAAGGAGGTTSGGVGGSTAG